MNALFKKLCDEILAIEADSARPLSAKIIDIESIKRRWAPGMEKVRKVYDKKPWPWEVGFRDPQPALGLETVADPWSIELVHLCELAQARLEEISRRLETPTKPFIQALLDSDSIFQRPDGPWQLRSHAIEAAIFAAVDAAGVINPGQYIVDNFLKAAGSKFKLQDVRDRLSKAKSRN